MPEFHFDAEEKSTLLKTARDSIACGLEKGKPLAVDPLQYSPQLQQQGASFVTLNLHGDLRGCIGTLQAWQPLIRDVADHAYAAAFEDPRFPPVTRHELPLLDINISVLSPAEPVQFESETDLLRQLRPGTDGLILQDGRHRGTFLPSVWESLPEPVQFLRHLKKKAGLSPDYWSDSLQVSRYTTVSIP